MTVNKLIRLLVLAPALLRQQRAAEPGFKARNKTALAQRPPNRFNAAQSLKRIIVMWLVEKTRKITGALQNRRHCRQLIIDARQMRPDA